MSPRRGICQPLPQRSPISVCYTEICQSFSQDFHRSFPAANVIALTTFELPDDFLAGEGTKGVRPMASLQDVLDNAASEIPLHLCPNCSAYIIAATSSERASDQCVRNVWSCEACGHEFETSAYFPTRRPSN